MMTWLRRIGGAVVMGVAWAVVWGPVAVLIGVLLVDPDNSMDEMWVAIGAIPGFLCGVAFAAVLGMAKGRRGFGELPLPRAAAWGAIVGLLVGALPFAVGDPRIDFPLWLLAVVVIGVITLMSALSAAGSVALVRMAEARGWLEPGAIHAGGAGGGAGKPLGGGR